MNNLLPPNATKQESALAGTTERIDAIPVKSRQMWNAQTCPAELLPWLAWALSVDEWNTDWSEQQKRNTIAASFAIHSTKGTLAAVKTSLMALGYESTVIEWFERPGELEPYTFTVDIDAAQAPITGDIFAESIRLIDQTKNTRSHLARLRVAAGAPVEFYAAATQIYGVYCSTGGDLAVVGGRPKPLSAIATAVSSAMAELAQNLTSFFALSASGGSLRVYKLEGSVFTQLQNPDAMPFSQTYSIDISSDTDYMVVAAQFEPYLYFYKHIEGEFEAFNKLPDPATIPPGSASGGAKFSPDGNFVLCGHVNGGMSIYQRDGDEFIKLTNPALAVTQNATSVAWNRNGDYAAVSSWADAPRIYARSGSTFTKIADPSVPLPVFANGMAFSPTSDLLVCAHQDAPYVTVSSITAGVHTRHADPSEQPSGTARCAAFNGDGSIVAIGTWSELYLYAVSGSVLTRITNPIGAPTGIRSVAFSKDGTILTLGLDGWPYLATYSVSGTTLTEISGPPSVPSQAISSVDFS